MLTGSLESQDLTFSSAEELAGGSSAEGLAGGSSAEGSVLRRSADFRRFFDFRCSSDFRRFAAGFGSFKMRDREDFPTGSTTSGISLNSYV